MQTPTTTKTHWKQGKLMKITNTTHANTHTNHKKEVQKTQHTHDWNNIAM